MLTTHVIVSVGLLGAIATFLALAVRAITLADDQAIRAAYLAMEPTAEFVIVPLSFVALATGLVQSLTTPWGLFRHYWILAKLLLTAFSIAILLVKLMLIEEAARLAAAAVLPRSDLHHIGIELTVHAAGGLLVLIVPTVLSIYKPWGPTAYGLRHRSGTA